MAILVVLCINTQLLLQPAPGQQVQLRSYASRDDNQPIASVPMDSASQRALDVLRRQDIEPTQSGIAFFLETLRPDHPEHERRRRAAKQWIEQLGHEQFDVRQRAHRALLRLETIPENDLVEATASGDPEVASRAELILEATRNRDYRNTISGITEAACVIIADREIGGLTSLVIETIPRFSEKQIQKALRDALSATCREQDLNLLKSATQAADSNVRIAAVAAMVKLSGADAKPDLLSLLPDAEAWVRLTAARELANIGARESLPVLVDLLSDDSLEIRLAANRVLRAVTGQRFEYYAYEDVDKRQAGISRWSDWLAGDGQTVELMFPLVEAKIEIGRILISDYQASKVVEYDSEGNKTWELDASYPWGVHGMPNGHRIVATYNPAGFVVYDENGELIWRKDELPDNAMGIDGVENGNVLVACSGSDRVIEYRPDGEIAWEVTLSGRPCDVQRLENGNTLVALINDNRVVEVNPEGAVVWEISDLRQPLTAQRLENGNTLVCLHGTNKAAEYAPSGEVVEEFDAGSSCSVARRLANGNTLLATQSYVKLVSPDGKELWRVDNLTYCYGAKPY